MAAEIFVFTSMFLHVFCLFVNVCQGKKKYRSVRVGNENIFVKVRFESVELK